MKNFFTLNEMASFIEHGYGIGIFAPGLKLPPDRLAQARHHAVLAHGLSVQAIRAKGRAGTRVGPAENVTVALPAFEIPAHIKAAEIATRELNAAYLTVMMEGRYTDAYLKGLGADAPKFDDGDLKIIASPVDFVGINVYAPGPYVLSIEAEPGYQVVKLAQVLSAHGVALADGSRPRCSTGRRATSRTCGSPRTSTSARTAPRARTSRTRTAWSTTSIA